MNKYYCRKKEKTKWKALKKKKRKWQRIITDTIEKIECKIHAEKKEPYKKKITEKKENDPK